MKHQAAELGGTDTLGREQSPMTSGGCARSLGTLTYIQAVVVAQTQPLIPAGPSVSRGGTVGEGQLSLHFATLPCFGIDQRVLKGDADLRNKLCISNPT